MIDIINKKLEELEGEGSPIRIGLIGAGYMGRGIAFQILKHFKKGMRLVAIGNRTLYRATWAYAQLGIENIKFVKTAEQLDDSIGAGNYAVTSDPLLICDSELVDVVVEATGTIEFASKVVMRAIRNRKHVVMMNAELGATLGPILKAYADKRGVVLTDVDGDQPGVIMNLLRFVESIGCKPLVAGNIKGFLERKAIRKSKMITSFTDGTKLNLEMTVVANATGFTARIPGMFGLSCHHVKKSVDLFPLEELLIGGSKIVDYVVDAEPPSGVFVIGYNEDEGQQSYLDYYKVGSGPFYVFYNPYHFCHMEVPLTIAKAFLFEEAVIAPLGPPVCEVITVAKRDLHSGEVLDGIGGLTCYGLIDNYYGRQFLPIGLSEGCILKVDVPIGKFIEISDVELPEGRLCDRLYDEQVVAF